MGKDWKNVEVHDFKSLQFFKEKVGGNMYIINDSGESSERKMESCRQSLNPLRVHLSNHKQNFGRNRR